jgi:hypothetical protein
MSNSIPFKNADYHLKMMHHHSKEYNDALRKGSKMLANDHAKMYHAHKEAIERAGEVGNHRKD